MHIFTFLANNLHQSAQVFEKAPDIQEEVRGKSNILMLHELAGKLMEAIREVKRDVDLDLHHATEQDAEQDDIVTEARRAFFGHCRE
jgi:hypothetical protein